MNCNLFTDYNNGSRPLYLSRFSKEEELRDCMRRMQGSVVLSGTNWRRVDACVAREGSEYLYVQSVAYSVANLCDFT